MKSLFDEANRTEILRRVESLQTDSPRQWGKMNSAQMLCHVSITMEAATGDRPVRQMFIGRILGPLFKGPMLGEKPFGRNGPTHPSFVVAGQHEFTAERSRLTRLIQRFADRGVSEAGKQTHAFLGRLAGEEWGVLMYKHVDHHLRQFGA